MTPEAGERPETIAPLEDQRREQQRPRLPLAPVASPRIGDMYLHRESKTIRTYLGEGKWGQTPYETE